MLPLIVTKRNVLNLIENKWLNFDWLTGIHWKEIKLESDGLTYVLFLTTFVVFVDWKRNDWIVTEKEITEFLLKTERLNFDWKENDLNLNENDVIRQHRCSFLLFCLLKNKWLNICLKNTRVLFLLFCWHQTIHTCCFFCFVVNTKKWHDLIFQHAPCPRQKKKQYFLVQNRQKLRCFDFIFTMLNFYFFTGTKFSMKIWQERNCPTRSRRILEIFPVFFDIFERR